MILESLNFLGYESFKSMLICSTDCFRSLMSEIAPLELSRRSSHIASGYVHHKRHGDWVREWPCFCLGNTIFGRQLRTGAIKDIVGIPASAETASEAAKAGVPLDQYQNISQESYHGLETEGFPWWLLVVSSTLTDAKEKKSESSLGQEPGPNLMQRESNRLSWCCAYFSIESGSTSLGLDDGSYMLILEHGYIDFAFGDADVMEEGTLTAVIGRQGRQGEEDSIIQEKTILQAAEKLVFLIVGKHFKAAVDGSVPVIVKSLTWMETAEVIDDLFLGDAEVYLLHRSCRKP
ncbi:hypothetical protein RJ639_001233 [Escallonia herrerae]|uniref:Uncharacterized protein n=1 Tax=Escallonia herrerae TaxID=1293975 RepID=A0AA89BGV1_9ASTE|nr:hypothetical protein RJ639_001233 [Escallonia herrerae]